MQKRNELFIYRFPLLNNLIEMGSTLKVGADEAAVLVKNGKVYDVFPKGEHILNTKTMPLLTKGLDLKKNHGFSCDVYFSELVMIDSSNPSVIFSSISSSSTSLTSLKIST